ncbi:MAG TPA: hypothetical protein VJ953_06080 [Saprospiraceae bacterium]|nr:hypothetical protein [Saprospiraceae bacterium]
MKPLFVITLISFFTLNLSAQTVAMETSNSAMKTTVSAEKKALIKRHTRSATQQIHVNLNKHLDYTPQMEEYRVEGEFELVVFLKTNGRVAKYEIEGEASPLLRHAVKEAMAKMDKILFRGLRYEGTSRVRVPVKFLKY